MKKTFLSSALLIALFANTCAANDLDITKTDLVVTDHTFLGSVTTQTMTIQGMGENSAIKLNAGTDINKPAIDLHLYGKDIRIESNADKVIDLTGYADINVGNYDYIQVPEDQLADSELLRNYSLTIKGREDAYALHMSATNAGTDDQDPYFQVATETLDVTGAIYLSDGAGFDMGWTNLDTAIEKGWVISLGSSSDLKDEYSDRIDSYRKSISIRNNSDKIATLTVDRGMVLMAAENVLIANTKNLDTPYEHGQAIKIVGGTYNSTDMGNVKTYVSIAAKDKLFVIGDILVEAGTGTDESAFVDIHSEGTSQIIGNIVVNGSEQAMAGVNIDISGANSILEGAINIGELPNEKLRGLRAFKANPSYADAAVQLNNGAIWKARGQSTITKLGSNGGIVELDSNSKLNTDKLEGSGLMVKINLDEQKHSDAKFNVKNKAEAKIHSELNATSDDISALEGLGLKNSIFGGSDQALTVSMSAKEGFNQGSWSIDASNNVTESNNTLQETTLDLSSATIISLDRILSNDLRKRMGDLRNHNARNGAWARYDGGRLSGKNAYENDFNTIQMGLDSDALIEGMRTGLAFSYTKGDADYVRGSADTNAYALAAYGTWYVDNGVFVDVIGRIGTIDTDMKVDGKTGKLDNMIYSLSAETGMRFTPAPIIYLEPNIELTYTYIGSDKVKFGSDATYDLDSTHSLVARAGFTAGLTCPSDKGDFYIRVNGAQQLLGDTKLTPLGYKTLEVDGKDSWVEFGIGSQWNMNKATYLWADVERTSCSDIEEDWRATVGVRYSF